MMMPPISTAYCILTTVEDGDRLQQSIAGHSAPNVRYPSAVLMMRSLLASRRRRLDGPDRGRGLYLFQYDDHVHQQVRSVALGRLVGAAPFVELIVDPYFFFGNGYEELRSLSAADTLPSWSERADTVFWRGSGSNNGRTATGDTISGLADVPRIALALRLRNNPFADVGVIGAWNEQPVRETTDYLHRERILRPQTPMREHANYRYQIDIDGVANAWATLERFLCGSCVLKVQSRFEMWYYPSLRPWVHYVPLRGDLDDLEERLEWCRAHPEDARAIAEAGRRFALALTYEAAIEHSVSALSACRIALS